MMRSTSRWVDAAARTCGFGVHLPPRVSTRRAISCATVTVASIPAHKPESEHHGSTQRKASRFIGDE